jgi:hypothetical protein
MKWDDKTPSDPKVYDLIDYISHTHVPVPEDAEFQLRPVKGHNRQLQCFVCGTPIGPVTSVWVGIRWLAHVQCGGHRPFSRGSAYRCTECSLMRCGIPNSRCEECAEHIARAG